MNKISDEIQEGVNDFKKSVDVLKVHRRYIYIIISLITIIVCLFLFRECQHQKDVDSLVKSISNYSDSAKHYKNKYGVVATNSTLKFDNSEQLKNYLSNNDTLKQLLKKFKKINTVTIIKEKIYIHDTVPIPYESTIPCDFEPFKVRRDTGWYHFVGTIHRNKFVIDTILIPNKQTIAVGYKRINLFKTESRVEVTNSNPFIQNSNVGGYLINDKKKWYQRPVVTFLIGTGIGSAATSIYGVIKK